MKRPKAKKSKRVDLYELKEALEEYFDHVEELGEEGYDGEHFVFEKAVEAIYGKNVWDYLNPAIAEGDERFQREGKPRR